MAAESPYSMYEYVREVRLADGDEQEDTDVTIWYSSTKYPRM